mgnify:CR=1 FL=1
MLHFLTTLVASWFEPMSYWQLSPVGLAVALALFSLLFEDVALLIGIATLNHNRDVAMPVFLGLFFGIVIGDVMLYATGRWLKNISMVQRFLARPSTHQRAVILKKNLLPMLVISRGIPASRLPTFLLAGVVRLNFMTFFSIIVPTVLLWVVLILFAGLNLAHLFEQSFGFSSTWLLLPLGILAVLFPFINKPSSSPT